MIKMNLSIWLLHFDARAIKMLEECISYFDDSLFKLE